jgi:hypothetical protein
VTPRDGRHSWGVKVRRRREKFAPWRSAGRGPTQIFGPVLSRGVRFPWPLARFGDDRSASEASDELLSEHFRIHPSRVEAPRPLRRFSTGKDIGSAEYFSVQRNIVAFAP